ncbi:hypothetical protein [Polyangium sp. y55x31]|uniref:hypothetical protein n=1 Tax=Polyangium sp. y55x31 TaxID=3042688 RepID=UPI002482D8B2|nr:hypothetical protein [Polyangium sp. y55x31]MDI1484642.1 hypothetical protein [Polyangium sp. y55x31]
MTDDTAPEDLALRKAVRLDRYAEILAHVVHFGADRTEEVVQRFGLTLDRWRAVDHAWTRELALGLKRQQREQALRFSATFNSRRERLARLQPSVAAIGDASAKVAEAPSEPTPPDVAAKPAGVPSFMLAAAASGPSATPSTATVSPWAAPAPIPVHTASPATTKPLPFVEGIPSTAALQSAVEHAQVTQGAPPLASSIGGTLPVNEEISAIARKLLPFGTQPSRNEPPARDSELTLEQHASLHVELDLDPEQRPEILRRYGLSAEQHARLHTTWNARMAVDPKLAAAWQQAVAQYRAWMSGTRVR